MIMRLSGNISVAIFSTEQPSCWTWSTHEETAGSEESENIHKGCASQDNGIRARLEVSHGKNRVNTLSLHIYTHNTKK